jgi:hypothetical protein
MPTWNHTPVGSVLSYDGYRASFPSRGGGRIYGQINKAVRFEKGDLLFNVHPSNVCYHFSPKTKRFTYVFELEWGAGTMLWSVMPDAQGNVYCTLSGMKTTGPVVDAAFGNWGGIVVVNPRKHLLHKIIEAGTVVDPYSLQLLPDGRLLVADFCGFGRPGRVYKVEPATGGLEVVLGEGLTDPTTAFEDSDGTLWIANGDQDEQDGELLAISKHKKRRVVYPRQGPFSGALLGVCRANDEEHVIATKNEWDERVHAKLFLIRKSDGRAEVLIQADEDNPMFFTNINAVVGDSLWFCECVNKELVQFDMKGRAVLAKYDLSPLMFGHRGMRNSFDSISGVYAVP